jgi:1-deoxyxylulose-5-phosphate synthase
MRVDMEYRKLGVSDLEVSVLAIGALHFGSLCSEIQSVQIINAAADRGINFLDTAPMYGQGVSEEIVGKALLGRRDNFIIGTKVGLKPIVNSQGNFGVETVKLNKENITSSVDNSLRKLKTDYIDLLQLHAYDPSISPHETFGVLAELVKLGKVRHVGVSNYDANQLKTMVNANGMNECPKIVSMQSHYNVMERRLEEEVIPECVRSEISTVCYRALGRGIITNKYSNGIELPPESRGATSERIRRHLTERNFSILSLLNRYVELRGGETLACLSIGWLLARKTVASMVLGMRNVSQLESNIRGLGFEMSEKDCAELDGLLMEGQFLDYVHANPTTFLEV